MGRQPPALARYWAKKRGGRKSRRTVRMARRRFGGRARRYYRKARAYRPKSLAVLAGFGVGMLGTAGVGFIEGYKQSNGSWNIAAQRAIYKLTGWDPGNQTFSSQQAMAGIGTVAGLTAGGWVLHKLAARSVNRYLPRGVKI